MDLEQNDWIEFVNYLNDPNKKYTPAAIEAVKKALELKKKE